MAHSRLSDPEYRNWVTVGRAIQITRNGLETIIQNAADKYHTSLLATLPKNVPAWEFQLKNAHRSRDKRKISWRNSDNTQWLTVGASWEIAKIFMAPLGPRKLDVVNAKTTDISGLLNVLEWSPRGTNERTTHALEIVKKEIKDWKVATNSRLENIEKAMSESQQLSCDVKQDLKFNPVSDRMKEEFVGREWLFSDIENWLQKDPGLGSLVPSLSGVVLEQAKARSPKSLSVGTRERNWLHTITVKKIILAPAI
ncbi:Hypothetical predicted protein [Paramuricea clavata]|uniref:Uncharacterized protein n=1 Tax=Paramuricea clavata TaxID=317549 RepID=A0A6S7JE18_PARCT|nr:Hypothetical predicted protein [Paramuricea clavata]